MGLFSRLNDRLNEVINRRKTTTSSTTSPVGTKTTTTTVETTNAGAPTIVTGRTYTVVKGDSLSAIALRYYGDANEYMRIYNANTSLLSDPDKIKPGQVLQIP